MGQKPRPYTAHPVVIRFDPKALALLDAWPGEWGRTRKINALIEQTLGKPPK
jgi:hypothetical protein